MRLSFRDLKQNKWFLELEPTATIAEVKAQNAIERNISEGHTQRFVHSGKILGDNMTIGELKYNPERDYIVCMISKTPAAKRASNAAQAAAPATGSAAQAPVAPSTEVVSSASNSNPEICASSSSSEADASSEPDSNTNLFQDPNAFAIGTQHEAAVASIVEMGYPREQVLVAMKMAYNNPDRAVEYIVTGEAEARMASELSRKSVGSDEGTHNGDNLDEEEEADEEDDSPALASATNHGNTQSGEGAGETTDVNLFEQVARSSQSSNTGSMEGLAALEDALINNPALVDPIIARMAATNPQLAADVLQHMSTLIGGMRGGEHAEDDEEMEGDEDEDDLPSGTIRVELTHAEEESISRLMELGFARGLVIQAYIACDRNEEITANYLFEHGDED